MTTTQSTPAVTVAAAPAPRREQGADVPPARPGIAQSRVEELVDYASLHPFGSLATGLGGRGAPGDGVLTGTAEIGGRPVAVFAQDPSVLGGSLGGTHARKIGRVLDHAARARVPVVGLVDSGGARIQEGVGALDGYGAIFRAEVGLSGRVPQLSVILGSCAGGAAYSPALTDIVIMSRAAHMFLTGPRVVAAVTGERITPEQLGGAEVHHTLTGSAHLVADDPAHAFQLTRQVLSYLPDSCWDATPRYPALPSGPHVGVPDQMRHAYDVRGVIRSIADGTSFLELQAAHAQNLVTGFARIDGSPVGFVANQPQALAGTLDSAAAEKGARFVRFCDAFGLPLVVLVDTPGFLPGRSQESGGGIRRGAKLLYAFAEATVPRVTVVLRKAFGGAYIVMNSRSLGADAVFAWPGAELAVMGAEAAVEIIHRRELDARPGRAAELLQDQQRQMTAGVAAARLSVDEVIAPEHTRASVTAALRALSRAEQPRFRHDNLPQ